MRSQINMSQTKPPPPLVRFGLTVLLLLMGLGGGAMIATAVRGVGEARESGSWPTVARKVVTSEMKVDTGRTGNRERSSDSTTYTAKVEYEFEVNGTKHRRRSGDDRQQVAHAEVSQ